MSKDSASYASWGLWLRVVKLAIEITGSRGVLLFSVATNRHSVHTGFTICVAMYCAMDVGTNTQLLGSNADFVAKGERQ